MKPEKKVDKTAWQCSGAVHHAMRVFTSQILISLQALLDKNRMITLDDDKLLKNSAGKQLQFTGSALLPELASLTHELIQQLLVERLVVERLSLIDLDGEINVVSVSAASAEFAFLLETIGRSCEKIWLDNLALQTALSKQRVIRSRQ